MLDLITWSFLILFGCYPINLFHENLSDVLGVYLNESYEPENDINNLESFLKNTLECIFEGVATTLIGNCKSQTIKLNLSQLNILTSVLSVTEKQELYTIGYNETIQFIREWA